MSVDVERLLRDGMDRFTADVRAPAGLAGAAVAARRRRRRVAIGSALSGTASAAAAAIIAVAGLAPTPAAHPGAPVRALDAAYVVHHVERALSAEHLVFRGQTSSTAGPSTTWAYGRWNRLVEYTGTGCGHALPSGRCSHRGGSQPYLAQGTVLVAGSLAAAYVTYYNRKYSLSSLAPRTQGACSVRNRLAMGGPPDIGSHWASLIAATLACGAASVTGHVRVDGIVATRVTGKALTVPLSPGYSRYVRERYARATWTLYVDPVSYLPVRMVSSTVTFGGPGAGSSDTSVTSVHWLPATPANIAQAKVTVPAGFTRVSSAASQ